MFNITSISPDEHISLAEIRLYTLVERDRNAYIGVDRKVSVLEVLSQETTSGEHFRLISSKHIYGRNSGWEEFDVTSAVERWIKNVNSVQILEIRIESVFHGVSQGDMDIDTRPHNQNEPLLVVSSNDYRTKSLHERETHELVTHEMDGYDVTNTNSEFSFYDDDDSSEADMDYRDRISANHRVKRSKGSKRNICRRKPMYVRFADINWHTWIIAPSGYQVSVYQ
jgi:hypothetical protein